MDEKKLHLNDCPFCGDSRVGFEEHSVSSEVMFDDEDHITHSIGCRNCGAHLLCTENKKSILKEIWNRRIPITTSE